eukprot:m.150155 g.150155  ORF g.150155 m.150155 type:complete len:624 (-) comp16309_c0_seq2:1892-3763(-)
MAKACIVLGQAQACIDQLATHLTQPHGIDSHLCVLHQNELIWFNGSSIATACQLKAGDESLPASQLSRTLAKVQHKLLEKANSFALIELHLNVEDDDVVSPETHYTHAFQLLEQMAGSTTCLRVVSDVCLFNEELLSLATAVTTPTITNYPLESLFYASFKGPLHIAMSDYCCVLLGLDGDEDNHDDDINWPTAARLYSSLSAQQLFNLHMYRTRQRCRLHGCERWQKFVKNVFESAAGLLLRTDSIDASCCLAYPEGDGIILEVLAPLSHAAVLTWLSDPVSLAQPTSDDATPPSKAAKISSPTRSLAAWLDQYYRYCQRREERLDDTDHLQQLFMERSDDITRQTSSDALATAPFFNWLTARLEWQLLQALAEDDVRAASRPQFSNTVTDSLYQSVARSRASTDHLRELRPGLVQALQEVTDEDLLQPLAEAGMEESHPSWHNLVSDTTPATDEHLKTLLQTNRRSVKSDYSHSERLVYPRKAAKTNLFRHSSQRGLRSSSQHTIDSSSSHDHASLPSGPSPTASAKASGTRLRKSQSASALPGSGWDGTRHVFRNVTRELLVADASELHKQELFKLLYNICKTELKTLQETDPGRALSRSQVRSVVSNHCQLLRQALPEQ